MGAFLVAGLLGFWGFSLCQSQGIANQPWLNRLYLTLQLFPAASGAVRPPLPWQLQAARFLAPVLSVYTLFWAIAFTLREHYHAARLRWTRGHVVVCGLGRNGPQLVREFLTTGRNVVAIEVNPHNENIQTCFELRSHIVIGDATAAEILRKARAAQAERVIAVTGDDSANAKIAIQLSEVCRTSYATHVPCHLHIVNHRLYDLLKQYHVPRVSEHKVRYHIFNVYQFAARRAFTDHPLVDPRRLADSTYSPLLILVGLGDMGESLLLQAIKVGHFPNSKRLRIVLVDKEATKGRIEFLARHPGLEGACTIKTFDGDVTKAETQQHIAALVHSAGIATIALCFGNDFQNVIASLEISRYLSDTKSRMLVRINQHAGLGTLLDYARKREQSLANYYPFGTVETSSTVNTLLHGELDELAQAFYEGFNPTNNGKNDWEELDEATKDIYRHRADHLHVKFHAIRCRVAKEAAGESFDQVTEEEIALMADAERLRKEVEVILGRGTTEASVQLHDTPASASEIASEISTIKKILYLLQVKGWCIIRRKRPDDFDELSPKG
jgi:hypothetical protein